MNWQATYRVTTPLFLGGANPGEYAELRPSSIKGLLRFWFRAIALPLLSNEKDVKQLEEEIFGSTKKQAAFLLTIREQKGLNEIKSNNWRNLHGLCYLGFGIIDRNGDISRPYLNHNGSFTVHIQMKKTAPKEAAVFLPITLQALGSFGAAGARSRKGFGSLTLKSLMCNNEEILKEAATIKELKDQQNRLLRQIKLDSDKSSLPEYTAFSNKSRIWIAKTGTDAVELLNEIGLEMLRYRSYGRSKDGKHILPDRNIAEQNFADDHDLLLDFCNGESIKTHPRRIVFGLPHNYFFLSTRNKVNTDPVSEDLNRRASPLFIHIHALSNNVYASVLTLLPAVFLPAGEKIKISSGRHRTTAVNCNVNFDDIANFMNRPAFSQSKVVVWP